MTGFSLGTGLVVEHRDFGKPFVVVEPCWFRACRSAVKTYDGLFLGVQREARVETVAREAQCYAGGGVKRHTFA